MLWCYSCCFERETFSIGIIRNISRASTSGTASRAALEGVKLSISYINHINFPFVWTWFLGDSLFRYILYWLSYWLLAWFHLFSYCQPEPANYFRCCEEGIPSQCTWNFCSVNSDWKVFFPLFFLWLNLNCYSIHTFIEPIFLYFSILMKWDTDLLHCSR